MSYTVAIRKNETGEVRTRTIDLEWNDDFFWWTEGNMSCDCNRYLEFARAGGADPEWDAGACGETAFTVLYVELLSGERIPIDSAADDSSAVLKD